MKPVVWEHVEAIFLGALEAFDGNVVKGLANQGDIQNGKGDFLNDILALILENCAQVKLLSRAGVPGFIFPHHNLDVTYPNSGVAQFLLEAKAVGSPKGPRNPKQKNPLGRPGSADLAKRIKEAAFKTIDLKAEYGRLLAATGSKPTGAPGGDPTSWLRGNRPSSYLFIAARVVDDRDMRASYALARSAAQVMDGVGLYLFKPKSARHQTSYSTVSVPPDIELSRNLYRACHDLVGIQGPLEIQGPAGPSEQAAAELAEPGQPESGEE